MLYICKKREKFGQVMYGVMDTDDGVVEYYSPKDICNFVASLGIKIEGVTQNGNNKFQITVLQPTGFTTLGSDIISDNNSFSTSYRLCGSNEDIVSGFNLATLLASNLNLLDSSKIELNTVSLTNLSLSNKQLYDKFGNIVNGEFFGKTLKFVIKPSNESWSITIYYDLSEKVWGISYPNNLPEKYIELLGNVLDNKYTLSDLRAVINTIQRTRLYESRLKDSKDIKNKANSNEILKQVARVSNSVINFIKGGADSYSIDSYLTKLTNTIHITNWLDKITLFTKDGKTVDDFYYFGLEDKNPDINYLENISKIYVKLLSLDNDNANITLSYDIDTDKYNLFYNIAPCGKSCCLYAMVGVPIGFSNRKLRVEGFRDIDIRDVSEAELMSVLKIRRPYMFKERILYLVNEDIRKIRRVIKHLTGLDSLENDEPTMIDGVDCIGYEDLSFPALPDYKFCIFFNATSDTDCFIESFDCFGIDVEKVGSREGAVYDLHFDADFKSALGDDFRLIDSWYKKVVEYSKTH